MAVERESGKSGEQFLSSDLVYEVLSRVEAMTLAKASCVSSQFRSVCQDEAHWEKLCNLRWPSTKEVSAVKALVASTGGFRKFYASCFPSILVEEARQSTQQLRVCDQDRIDELGEVSASDFISIVDVVYNGESVLSRVVEGIPTAETTQAWVISRECPFRMDVLETPDPAVDDLSRKDDEGVRAVTIGAKLPGIASAATEHKDGQSWAALCDEMRVSWILIDKKTLRMANLASWKPLGGLRLRPSGEDSLRLRFGSILPTSTTNSNGATHCNITMKCSTTAATGANTDQPTTLRLTELSLQLEDANGAHLNEHDAIATLSRALILCYKTVAESEVASMYHAFVAALNARREDLIRREHRRRTVEAVIVAIVTSCICFFSVFF